MSPFAFNAAAALAVFGSTASAHMILQNPTPYSADSLTNSPLSSSGSDYPCQTTGDSSFWSTDGISNEVNAGDTISMSFKGSAVHGGGSCQVALSTDMQPSQSTRWSVIHSILSGCPSRSGDSADTYDITIPSDIPAGTYSYAWTWTSKLSGTQEYYMNCAPITVKGSSGSKKRSQNLRARADALDNYPPLAVYNMNDLNSCKSELSSDVWYPYPGNYEIANDSPTFGNLTGSDCFAKGVTYDGSSSGSSSSDSSSSSGDSSSSSSGSSSSSADSSSATGSGSSDSGSDSGSGSGGVFATGAATSSASTPAATGSSSSGSSGSSSGTGTSSSSGSSSSSSSGSCTAGEYKCSDDGSSYQQCEAGGTWSVSMSMASGTACEPGTSSGLSISATKRRSFRA